ncbi:hypothetical protein BDK92_6354 [Micromonospora pisi]|uniref:Uncharacterized protein n=1 Tax=Micromonospora pisi TaxID=589240 RepID=A0A495JSH6_9ACTN|nr:hypothetical protein [Micromonospora pisi]RKR91923.1 hypothetical protein BDK92_6354 [Micromonospora pisi]
MPGWEHHELDLSADAVGRLGIDDEYVRSTWWKYVRRNCLPALLKMFVALNGAWIYYCVGSSAMVMAWHFAGSCSLLHVVEDSDTLK